MIIHAENYWKEQESHFLDACSAILELSKI